MKGHKKIGMWCKVHNDVNLSQHDFKSARLDQQSAFKAYVCQQSAVCCRWLCERNYALACSCWLCRSVWRKLDMISIGTGKTMVLLCSADMEFNVCRYRSWKTKNLWKMDTKNPSKVHDKSTRFFKAMCCCIVLCGYMLFNLWRHRSWKTTRG